MPQDIKDVRELEVIAANLKRRHTGVTSTISALLPIQSRDLRIAALGPNLPGAWPTTSMFSLLRGGWSRPPGRSFRIWHARRNNEMLLGWLLRSVLRMPMKLVFTSAAQRDHSRWTKFLIARMDAVIATSPESGAYLRVPHSVIMHGVDTSIYLPAENRERAWAGTGLPGRYGIGIFGRVRSQKGSDLFVDAMCELLPRYLDFTAVLVGPITFDQSEFVAKLKKRISTAGLSERIVFMGELPPEDVPVWLRSVTIVVSPQRWEGFGLVPAEAMASGTAVVATKVGAARHLILDGRTGFLVEAGDTAALTRRLDELMREPDRADEWGRRGRGHIVDNFSIEREAKMIEKVYRRLWS